MSASQAPVLTIRVARAADAERVAEIYNQGIAERSATFETDPRAPADLVRRIEEDPQRFPVLVAEDAGSILGWASIGPYRDRRCYAGVGEFSVYIHRGARGRGVGRARHQPQAARAVIRAATAHGSIRFHAGAEPPAATFDGIPEGAVCASSICI